MQIATVLSTLALTLITGCSTGHDPVTLTRQETACLGFPAGDFVQTFGGTSQPAVKLRLNSDGTYVIQRPALVEFWPMIEGNKVYPQRTKPSVEKGHWAWERSAGALTFAPEKAPGFIWVPLSRLQFDPAHPDHLSGDGGLVLQRAEK